MRYAARCDTAKAAIVNSLQKHGYMVYDLRRPVDIAVRKQYWHPGQTVMLEIKSLTQSGKAPKPRPSQISQNRFIADFAIPVVCTPVEALNALAGL